MSREPFSELLALLHVQSFLSRRLEASGRWALRFPDYAHMKFGGVIEGTRWIWIEGLTAPLKLEAGDFYLLSHGGPYCIASDPDAPPRDGIAFMEEHLQPDGVVRFTNGSGRSVGVGGRFTFDNEAGDFFLSMLPPIIHVPGHSPHARGLPSVLDLLTLETEAARPGSAAIGGGLCMIVLVNILRTSLASEERPGGWLGALQDRQIGVALRRLHSEIARRWTVGELAQEAGMSRAAFASRFKALIGMAPFEYMTRWRMLVASNALRRDRASLAAVAEAVGYESETAFSLAFKRRFGSSPGRYRSMMRNAPVAI